MSSYLGILFMRFLAKLPLPLVRGFAAVIGRILFVLAVPRRRVVLRNLELCFPQESAQQRKQWARESFVYFCQAWLDRSWLWHAPLPVLQKRLKLHGAVHELEGTTPTIIFGPHFYGLDAAATAIGMSTPRLFTSIYTPLPDKRLDDWIKQVGWEVLVNRQGTTWRQLDEATAATLRASGETVYTIGRIAPRGDAAPVVVA